MIVSIETPVFKGGWLQRCIDSVLNQSSDRWTFSLLWDGGDEESRRILERLERMKHPRVRVHFAENRGIARARRFLSESSAGDWILPLDDDDVLPGHAVEAFLAFAESRPWSGIVRARRKFIDESGRVVDMEPWFPFEPRHAQFGMVTDVFNHSQPYLIRRAAYRRTGGWEGFPDFMFAGEDCDIFLKVEEVAPVELLDQVLYYYRLHPDRASDSLTPKAAYEMWRRLADRTIERLGLPLRRANDMPPFRYERLRRPAPARDLVDFVVAPGEPGRAGTGPAPALRSLGRCGIPEAAVHLVPGGRGRAAARNEGFRRTARPLLCFLDEDVDLGPEALDGLLAALHQREADLAGPRIVGQGGEVLCGAPTFDGKPPVPRAASGRGRDGEVAEAPWLPWSTLLVRREVVGAVGGFDEEHVGDGLADVDFSLRARQRDFGCLHVGTVEVVKHGAGIDRAPPAGLAVLHARWQSHPHLLEWPPPRD